MLLKSPLVLLKWFESQWVWADLSRLFVLQSNIPLLVPMMTQEKRTFRFSVQAPAVIFSEMTTLEAAELPRRTRLASNWASLRANMPSVPVPPRTEAHPVRELLG